MTAAWLAERQHDAALFPADPGEFVDDVLRAEWRDERTRRGEIPGCIKLGGMLFFEREPALAWLRAGATTK